jgi:hypothetical protein
MGTTGSGGAATPADAVNVGPAGGRRFRIGVDIGGTFTDLCVAGDEGLVAIGKTLTTREEPASAIETVIRETLEANGIGIDEISDIVHGTTLVTNAIIERKGSPTALLATAGHRDAIEIARERRYEIYDLDIELPQPLVPRHLRFDIPERTMADGTIAEEVDVQFVRALARELVEHGIEAVAIAFLHSFTNPRNEQRAADAIREAAPDLRVSLSSEVAPEIREYERSSTTVANVWRGSATPGRSTSCSRTAASRRPRRPRAFRFACSNPARPGVRSRQRPSDRSRRPAISSPSTWAARRRSSASSRTASR